MGTNQQLCDKYRPLRVAEFVGLDKPRKILARFAQNPYPAAFLFCGSPGTGKTSMALALAAEIGAELHHVPSQSCTVENVRSVVNACYHVPMFGTASTYHVVLVDEADKMSAAAQLAFLSLLDGTQTPPATIFLFTSNATDSLEPRFLSRVKVLEFSSYGLAEPATQLLARVWQTEAPADAEAPNLARLMKDTKNNIRDALQRLELELLAV